MNKDLTIGKLNDIYGFLLTERQREIVDGYYNFDFSLREMAENYRVTRQAVLDALHKGEGELKRFEARLRVYELSSTFGAADTSINEEDLRALVDRARSLLAEVI